MRGDTWGGEGRGGEGRCCPLSCFPSCRCLVEVGTMLPTKLPTMLIPLLWAPPPPPPPTHTPIRTRMIWFAAVSVRPTVATLALSRNMVVGGSFWKSLRALPLF